MSNPEDQPDSDAVSAAEPAPRTHRVVVLSPGPWDTCQAQLAAIIGAAGGTLTASRHLSAADTTAQWADGTQSLTAIELTVTGVDGPTLRAAIGARSDEIAADVAVLPPRPSGRRLVVLDVDSTFIDEEVIELIAGYTGTEPQVAAITARAMAGELDFSASLHERAALLAHTPTSVLDDVRTQIHLTPGAATLCRTLTARGDVIALVSGGFTTIIQPLADQLGVTRVRANTLEVRDEVLTGRVLEPIIDRAAKAEALREFAAEFDIPPSHTVAVGDGANDLDMVASAGIGIAFAAKAVLRESADASITPRDLTAVLYLMGLSDADIARAGTPGTE